MYEIWLAANIVYEVVLLNWPLLAGYLALWLILWIIALRRGLSGRFPPLKPVSAVWLLGTVLGMVVVPYLTHAKFSDLGYWVDWANLFAIAAGTGAAIALLAWPLLLTCARSRRY